MKSTKITRSLILILCIFSTTAGARKNEHPPHRRFPGVPDRLKAALADKERPPIFSRKTMAVLKELEKSVYN